MDIETIIYIKSNPLVYNFLREDSSWYHALIRDKTSIKQVEAEAKKFYKQTTSDKLEKLSQNIELLTTFMDVLK